MPNRINNIKHLAWQNEENFGKIRNENRPQRQESKNIKERPTTSATARVSQRLTVLNDVGLEEDTLP
jgi:hypothetical protein